MSYYTHACPIWPKLFFVVLQKVRCLQKYACSLHITKLHFYQVPYAYVCAPDSEMHKFNQKKEDEQFRKQFDPFFMDQMDPFLLVLVTMMSMEVQMTVN